MYYWSQMNGETHCIGLLRGKKTCKALWVLSWLFNGERNEEVSVPAHPVRHMVGVSRNKKKGYVPLSLLGFQTAIQTLIEHKYKYSPQQRLVSLPKFWDKFFSGAEQLLHLDSNYSVGHFCNIWTSLGWLSEWDKLTTVEPKGLLWKYGHRCWTYYTPLLKQCKVDRHIWNRLRQRQQKYQVESSILFFRNDFWTKKNTFPFWKGVKKNPTMELHVL